MWFPNHMKSNGPDKPSLLHLLSHSHLVSVRSHRPQENHLLRTRFSAFSPYPIHVIYKQWTLLGLLLVLVSKPAFSPVPSICSFWVWLSHTRILSGTLYLHSTRCVHYYNIEFSISSLGSGYRNLCTLLLGHIWRIGRKKQRGKWLHPFTLHMQIEIFPLDVHNDVAHALDPHARLSYLLRFPLFALKKNG